MELIDQLINQKWLKSEEIIEAFRKVKRADFLTENIENPEKIAQLNEALPIGNGQTISQPLVVAFMIELLSPQKGEKILDVGTGSGWTPALLSQIVGKKGKVIGVEVLPELYQMTRKNISKYGFLKEGRAEIILRNATRGLPEYAPFDRILCSASAQEKIPRVWKEELKKGGKIVAPVGSSIRVAVKQEKGFKTEDHPGFAFVPLINK